MGSTRKMFILLLLWECAMIAKFAESTAAYHQKKLVYNWIENTQEFEEPHKQHIKEFRQRYELDKQEEPANSQVLDCEYGKVSETEPTSVHRLRAGDIDIIAAMGDSNTAANGAKAFTIKGCVNEYRGVSWSIGSDKSLERGVTTLPNILKTFNPLLYGPSTGKTNADGRKSRLNLAVPGSQSIDMPQQARNLIQKLRQDNLVNIEVGWKLITMFIGGNDLCRICKDEDAHSPDTYIQNIQEALDILHEHLPRALINVVPYFDISPAKNMADNFICKTVQVGVCSCVSTHSDDVSRNAKQYQRRLHDLIASGRYDTSENFTVVYQPFFEDTTPPVKINGEYDLSYFAPDCFHFSQKGHALAATTLWNTMFEPVGSKRTDWRLNDKMQCPNPEFPYIATNINSNKVALNSNKATVTDQSEPDNSHLDQGADMNN